MAQRETDHPHKDSAEWLVAGVAAAAVAGFSESGRVAHAVAYLPSRTCFTWAIILFLVAATVWYLHLFFRRMKHGEKMLRVIFHSDLHWLEHVPHISAFLALLGSIVTVAGYVLILLN